MCEFSQGASVKTVSSGLQVHHTDPPQMHVGHPADQLQPRQQHFDRRLWRRFDLALGPAALSRLAWRVFGSRRFLVPNCCPDVQIYTARNVCLNILVLRVVLKYVIYFPKVRSCANVRWFLLSLWPRRMFSFPVCLPEGFVWKSKRFLRRLRNILNQQNISGDLDVFPLWWALKRKMSWCSEFIESSF